MILPPDSNKIAKEHVKCWVAIGEDRWKDGVCMNCGGTGIVAIIAAIAGPIADPENYKFERNPFYYGKEWWDTRTFTGDCPVCLGYKDIDPMMTSNG